MISFEIIPKNIYNVHFINTIDKIVYLNLLFINITNHNNYIFNYRYNILLKYIKYKSILTFNICNYIINKYNINSIPHILYCKISINKLYYILNNLFINNIDNILILKGDIINNKYNYNYLMFFKNKIWNKDILEKIKKIKYILLEKIIFNNLYIFNLKLGVAGYPEKHIKAKLLINDLYNLKKKINNGSNYIITQMFFNNRYFYKFKNLCISINIMILIVPGIKLIYKIEHIYILPYIFNININTIVKEKTNNFNGFKKIINIYDYINIIQIKELSKYNFKHIHYYIMNNYKMINEVLI